MYFASMILNLSLVWKTSLLLFFPAEEKKIFLREKAGWTNISPVFSKRIFLPAGEPGYEGHW